MGYDSAQRQARAELGMAVGARAEEVCRRTIALDFPADRDLRPSPAYIEYRSARIVMASLFVCRWLVCSVKADTENMDWLTRSGALAAREGIPFVDTTRGYFHWRDSLIEVVREEALRLEVPVVILEEAVRVVGQSCDASFVRVSDAYDSQLRAINSLFKGVIDNAPLGIARLDRHLRITSVNPRMSDLIGGGPITVGTLLSDHLPAADVARVFGEPEGATGKRIETYETDSHVSSSAWAKIWLHWTATAVRDPDGNVDYFIAMFEDVTAKHEAEELAMASLASLERLNRLKSEFVSMVSHEFRTALVGIQGFSEVIRDDAPSPAEATAFAADIYKAATRLNRMISEMLDLERMESGRMALQLVPMDINATILESVETAAVTSPKHSITVDLEPNLPTVLLDADRMMQVMSKLLNNAIRYSPAGGDVHISSRCEDGAVHVRVRDHGIGIPPEVIDRLFARYERFENTGPNKIMGTGLGLVITRQILEMHDGRIWVESTFGDGAEFQFTIPLRRPLLSEPAAACPKAVEAIAGTVIFERQASL